MKQTTRYPWHLAPEWAKSAATHLGGAAFWYGDPIAEEPSENFPNGCWFFKTEQIEGSFDPSDWQNSLELRPTKPLTIGEAMQRNAEAAARLLEAPTYREQLRAEFAGRVMAEMIGRGGLGAYEFIASNALAYADALLNQLYPSPQNTTEHGK